MGDTVASPSKAPSSQPGVERAALERGDIDGEVALRESEAHYRVPWTAGPGGELLDISTRWSELTGLAREQILCGEGREAIHPEDRHGAMSAWQHSIATGEPYDVEFRVRLVDGLHRWMRDRAFPRRDEVGRVERWFGFIEDVHEHHLTVAALKASEERFHLATEAVVGFLYDYDMVADRSERFGGTEQALGFAGDELVHTGEWWVSRIHPDDVSRVMDDVRRYLDGDASHYTHEYRFRHKDGHYVHLSDRGRIVRDPEGRPIRMLGGITDVSEQKQLEQEREKLLAEVQWERSRLREIFNAAPSFFALTRGPDHVYEYVNEAYYRFTGQRDLIGRRVFDVFPEGNAQGYSAIRERLLREGGSFEGKELPLAWVTPDGTRNERFMDVTLLPFVEPDGTRSGIISHGMDVTAHVLARREVEWLLADSEGLSDTEREARKAAEKAIQARDEMLRVVSHELGGPLSVISMAVAGILESVSVPENAAVLKRATEWMERLLHDLVDVASFESGRFALAPVPETPRALVTQAVEMLEGAAQSGGVTLEAVISPDLPLVVVDPARVLQALTNLVTNALRATRPGGRVTLLAERDAAGVRLTVEDTGCGIAPERVPHIFDRQWQQLHHTNAGLGLGLAIARGIVEAHGGELQVESAPAKGSRFSFTIPSGLMPVAGSISDRSDSGGRAQQSQA
jgi:PAS domain S-box-containing protein